MKGSGSGNGDGSGNGRGRGSGSGNGYGYGYGNPPRCLTYDAPADPLPPLMLVSAALT